MEGISIREVTANDVEFLFQLMNNPAVMKALNEVLTRRSDWEETVLAWRDDADEKGYIVFDDAIPIGWFAVNGLLAEDHSAYLKMAALLPAWQGRHIGRHVVAEILETLRSAGVARVSLFTNRSNRQAQKCYEACGFQVTGTLTEEMSDRTTVERYRMERSLQEK